MPTIDNYTPCQERDEILELMKWAVKVQNGYIPADMPSLTAALSAHKRGCPYCQGNASPLADALFCQHVEVAK